jgi:hypothetical protein
MARFPSVIEDNIKTDIQGTGWKVWTGCLCGLTFGCRNFYFVILAHPVFKT